MPKAIKVTSITEHERTRLQQIATSGYATDTDLWQRATALLLLSEKMPESTVAKRVHASVPTIRRWREAFEKAPNGKRVEALMELRGARGKGIKLTGGSSSEAGGAGLERLGKFQSDFTGGIPDLETEIRNALRLCRQKRMPRRRDKESYLPCIVLGCEGVEVIAGEGICLLDVPYAIYFDSDHTAMVRAAVCVPPGTFKTKTFLEKLKNEIPAPESVRLVASPAFITHFRTSLPNSPQAQEGREELKKLRKEMLHEMKARLLKDSEEESDGDAWREYMRLTKNGLKGWIPIVEDPESVLLRLMNVLPHSVKEGLNPNSALKDLNAMIEDWSPNRYEPKFVKLRVSNDQSTWVEIPSNPDASLAKKKVLRMGAMFSAGPHCREYRSKSKLGKASQMESLSTSRPIYDQVDDVLIRRSFPNAYFWSNDAEATAFRNTFETPLLRAPSNFAETADWLYKRWGEASIVERLIRFIEELKDGGVPPPNLTNSMRNTLDNVSQLIWLMPAEKQDAVIHVIRHVLDKLKEKPPACFVHRIDGFEDGHEMKRKNSYRRYIAKCRRKFDEHVKQTIGRHPCSKMGLPYEFGEKILSSHFNYMAKDVLLEVNPSQQPYRSATELLDSIEKWGLKFTRRINSKKYRRERTGD